MAMKHHLDSRQRIFAYLDNPAGTLRCHNPGSCKLDNTHNYNQVENLDNPRSHLQKEHKIKESGIYNYEKIEAKSM